METKKIMTQSAAAKDAAPHDDATGDLAGKESDNLKSRSTEVRPTRRRFTLADKRRILAEADACAHGKQGLLLRREGIYSSTLAGWRRQLSAGSSLAPQKRGVKAVVLNPLASDLAQARRALSIALERNRQLELIVDVQKKLSQLLGLTQTEGAH